jgi:hypothetical protein
VERHYFLTLRELQWMDLVTSTSLIRGITSFVRLRVVVSSITLAGQAGTFGSTDGTWECGALLQTLPESPWMAPAMSMPPIRATRSFGRSRPAAWLQRLPASQDFLAARMGIGSAARFRSPAAVAVDGAGNVYVADLNNCAIRKITSGGAVTTLAGQAAV